MGISAFSSSPLLGLLSQLLSTCFPYSRVSTIVAVVFLLFSLSLWAYNLKMHLLWVFGVCFF